jgi:MipA family protein
VVGVHIIFRSDIFIPEPTLKKRLCREHQLLLSATLFLLYSGVAHADGVGTEPPEEGDSGFTVLSNATNVTHWGLGAGAGVGLSPYKGYGTKFTPIPLISFDNKWVHFLGTTADLKLGTWDHVSVALRGKFEIGSGYTGADSPDLSGMHNRKGAFWYGPAVSWATAFGTLSGDFLLGGNRGEQANIDFSKSFDYGPFTLTPHAGVDWLSDKYTNYYYGVLPSEVRAGRPEYSGKGTYDESIGTGVNYKFAQHQNVLLDVSVKHLGSGITDSPIVGKRYIPQLRIGYLYQFN